jgi:hypothetical protein
MKTVKTAMPIKTTNTIWRVLSFSISSLPRSYNLL